MTKYEPKVRIVETIKGGISFFDIEEYLLRDWDDMLGKRFSSYENHYYWKQIGKAQSLEQAQRFKDDYIKTKRVTTIIHD